MWIIKWINQNMGKKYDCSYVKEGEGLMITVNKG